MSHSRKIPARAALPRRTTKGPLEGDDPLLLSPSPGSPASKSPSASSLAPSPQINPTGRRSRDPSPLPNSSKTDDVQREDKDLSFLLDASIYHPLSQLEVPGPFRRPFPPQPSLETPLEKVLEDLNQLLFQCDYLRAGHLAGSILTSGILQPSDSKTIFHLLAVRYSCLELSGNVLLAAQEAKALEDLSSAFYYIDPVPLESEPEMAEEDRPPPEHIMPFTLRLQALRLQSIGFSDPRRGVSSLYDLGLECREQMTSSNISPDQVKIWSSRLEEIGIRVINALIEMGDLDCARRTLETLKPSSGRSGVWHFRMALLHLRMGMLKRVQALVNNESDLDETEKLILKSLLAISEDQLDLAVNLLCSPDLAIHADMLVLAKQNLAVAYLYRGEVQTARALMESLVDDRNSFQTLTVNLATIYDLTSDRSRTLKTSLANKIADQAQSSHQSRSFTNADFKL